MIGWDLLSVVSWILLAAAAHGQRMNSLAGPFRLVPDHIAECPVEMTPPRKHFEATIKSVRDRKDPDVWYYSGNGTLFTTVDDNYTGLAQVASWSSGGGWKENFFRLESEKALSRAKQLYPNEWRHAMKLVFKDPNRMWPFLPGYYSVYNVSTKYDLKVPPVYFYGRYRATVRVFNTVTKELMSCVQLYGSVVPKTMRRPPK